MPPPYINPHWSVFSSTPYRPQGAVGIPPADWVAKLRLAGVPNAGALPRVCLDRHDVRLLCRNPSVPVLFGYVCAMAWGGQGVGTQARHAIEAWRSSGKIASHLNLIKTGGLTRDSAYGLFLHGGAVPHLGPSFFTKLLYFFSPLPNFYIMDSRVAQAVILLTGNWITKMNGGTRSLLSPSNNIGNYRTFCEEIDLMALALACTGSEVEERLFSKGGRHPWPWRNHIAANWGPFLETVSPSTYSASRLHAVYPHIPLMDFL